MIYKKGIMKDFWLFYLNSKTHNSMKDIIIFFIKIYIKFCKIFMQKCKGNICHATTFCFSIPKYLSAFPYFNSFYINFWWHAHQTVMNQSNLSSLWKRFQGWAEVRSKVVWFWGIWRWLIQGSSRGERILFVYDSKVFG